MQPAATIIPPALNGEIRSNYIFVYAASRTTKEIGTATSAPNTLQCSMCVYCMYTVDSLYLKKKFR